MGNAESNAKSSLLKNFTYLIGEENTTGSRRLPQYKLMYFDYLNFLKYEIDHEAWKWKIYSDYVKQNGAETTDNAALFCGWKNIQEKIFKELEQQLQRAKPPTQKKYNWNYDVLPLINIGQKKVSTTLDCSKIPIQVNNIDVLQNAVFPALSGGTSGTNCQSINTASNLHIPLRRRALVVEGIGEYLQEIKDKSTDQEILKEVIERKLDPQNHIGKVAGELKKKMIQGLSTEFSNLIKQKNNSNHRAFCKEWQRTMDDYHTLFLGDDIVDENETKGIQCTIKLIEAKMQGKAKDFKTEWSKYFKDIVQDLWQNKFKDPNTGKSCTVDYSEKSQCIRFFEEWAEEFCKLKKDLGDLIVENCEHDNKPNTTECKNLCSIYKKFLDESEPYYENYKTKCAETKFGYEKNKTDLEKTFINAAMNYMQDCCIDRGHCSDKDLFDVTNDKSNIRYKCLCEKGKYYSNREKQTECKDYVTQNTVDGRTLAAQQPLGMSQSASTGCGAGKPPPNSVKQIAQQLQAQTKHELTTTKPGNVDYLGTNVLEGDISNAKFKNGGKKLNKGEICNLEKETHTNDEREYRANADGDKYHDGPCTGKGTGDDINTRFKIGTKWVTHDKVHDDHKDVLLPPRRRHICTSNLENLDVDNAQGLKDGNKVNDSFFADVLVTAKEEGRKIIEMYKKNNKLNDDNEVLKDSEHKETVCRAMKASFADIADIIRGRDVWTKESGNEKLQEKLVKIFKNINENKSQITQKYEDDNGKYTTMRNDWWETNRDQVWNAMKCSANNICSDTSTPHEDYIPQRLRWLTEWVEWFCKAQKKHYDEVVTKCSGCKDGGNNVSCTKCPNCKAKCEEYKKIIGEWETDWETQKNQYTQLYEKAKNNNGNGGNDENEKYLNKFLYQLHDKNNNQPRGSNNPFESAAGYVHEILKDMECKEQNEFCVKKNGGSNENEKYAFKYKPHDYTTACGCQNTPVPPPPRSPVETPKCTGNKILDAANTIQVQAKQQLGSGDLKGKPDQGTYKHSTNASILTNICEITKEHTNDVRDQKKRPGGPCEGKGNGKNPEDQRFIIGGKWETKDSQVNPKHPGVLLPPRRRHMCTSNLENLGANGGDPHILTHSNINDSFLGDVLLAANFEGQDIVHKLSSKNDISGICNAMKYSFADLGDIIRGRDLWSKEKGNDELQGYLEKIFKKIHQKNGGGSTGKYASDSETSTPPFKQLREDWWEANRKEIWKAMTCSAPVDANLSIPSSDPNIILWQGPQCGRNNQDFVPYDDYIPQKLRWLTEWTENYCKKIKTDYYGMMGYCGACKIYIKQKKDQESEAKKAACKMCVGLCTQYTNHVKEWKDQWKDQKTKYEKLYSAANDTTPTTTNDPIKEKHEEFLRKVKDPNSCNTNSSSNTDYSKPEEFVESMGGYKYCKDTSQREYKDNKASDEAHVLQEKPKDYNTECEWQELTPAVPPPPPQSPRSQTPCEIVKEILKNNDGNTKVGDCNLKYDQKNKPQNTYPEWDCTKPEKQGLIRNEDQDACMPPRRQKLCIHYLKDLNSQKNTKKKDDLRKALIECAAAETFLHWQYFIQHGRGKRNSQLLVDHLKKGTIPDEFLRSMFFTYGDFRDLCLGKDIGSSDDTKNISVAVKSILDKENGQPTGQSPDDWWDTIKNDVWKGMLCGLSYHIDKDDEQYRTKLTEKEDYQYKLDFDPKKTDTGIGTYLLNIELTPQFLRWFIEWSDDFCKKQLEEFEKLHNKCKTCKVKTDKKTCENKQKCEECQNECPEYKTFINKWKKDYDKQKDKFDRDKNKYDDVPFVEKDKNAHQNLDLALEMLDVNGNCMEDTSTQNQDMPKSLDETPDEFKPHCVCTDPSQHVAPKCTNNKILDVANFKLYETQKELGTNSGLVGNIVNATFKDGSSGNDVGGDICQLDKMKHTNDVREKHQRQSGPCEGKGTGSEKRFIIGDKWKKGGDDVKEEHKEVLLPPRRRHMCTSNLENLGANGDDPDFINKGNNVNDIFLGDVLLAAKYEGDDIVEKHLSKNDKSGICNAMKYSFADLGDIIRGRDLWSKEKGNEDLQKYLVKIFKKVHENHDGATKYANGQIESPPYKTLREHWWIANREQIWKAMTCTAPDSADLYIPTTGGTKTWERYKCGRDSYVPPDDYIPQRLRWMTEWSESYCKQLERNYWPLSFSCGVCRSLGKSKKKKENSEAEQKACSMCSGMCGVYKEHVKTWKLQWDQQKQQYSNLYANKNSGAPNNPIEKQHEQFLQNVKTQKASTICSQDTTDYNNLANYVTSMGGSTYCNDTSQTKFNDESDAAHVFKEQPKDYKKECEKKQATTPKNPKGPKPTDPLLTQPCDIVEQTINHKGNDGSIDNCNAKNFDNNAWKCEGKIKTAENNGACMPLRRQKLCIHDLTQQIDNKDKLREAFIKSAAKETNLLWDNYTKNKNNKGNLYEGLKKGNIPHDFMRMMFYTYGDYRDLCLGEDIGDDNGKNIKDKVTSILNSQSPEDWWDENGLDIWQGMLCGLSHHISDKNSRSQLTQNPKYKYAADNLTSGIAKYVLYTHTTPQFLRWFTEWADQFCLEQMKQYVELHKACKKCNGKNGSKTTCTNDGECTKCKEQCQKYTEFINEWKVIYTNQKGKFDKEKDKEPYKDAPFVDDKIPAYQYLDQQLELFNLHDNCMKQPSTQKSSGKDMPASLDDLTKSEYKEKCDCQEDKVISTPGVHDPGSSGTKCEDNLVIIKELNVGNNDLKICAQKDKKFLDATVDGKGENVLSKRGRNENGRTTNHVTLLKILNTDSYLGTSSLSPCKNNSLERKKWICDKNRNNTDYVPKEYNVCLPPRTQILCVGNLNVDTTATNSKSRKLNIDDVNDKEKLLTEVLVAAKYEGENLNKNYKHHIQNDDPLKENKQYFCSKLKYSFGDLADIIKGTKTYDPPQKDKTENNLQTIFEKIYEKLENGEQSKYKHSSGEPKYKKLREEWWEANREYIWKILLDGAAPTKIPDCLESFKNNPPNIDYIPQFLRFAQEWGDEFCVERKKLANAVVTKCEACKKASDGYHEKNTIGSGTNDGLEGKECENNGSTSECKDCKDACEECKKACGEYKTFVEGNDVNHNDQSKTWRQLWKEMEEKYNKLIGDVKKKLEKELDEQRKKTSSQRQQQASPKSSSDNIPPYMMKCDDKKDEVCLKPDVDSFFQYLHENGISTLSSYINSVSKDGDCGKDEAKWGNTVVVKETSGSNTTDMYPQPLGDRPIGYKYACQCKIPSRNELCDDNHMYNTRWECNSGSTPPSEYELCRDTTTTATTTTSSSLGSIQGTKLDEKDVKFFNLFDLWYKDIQNRLDHNIRRIKDQCDKEKIMAQTSGSNSSGTTRSPLCLGCRDSCECYKLWVNHMNEQWQKQKTNFKTFEDKQKKQTSGQKSGNQNDVVDMNKFLFASCWEDYLQKSNRGKTIENLDAHTDGDTIDVLIDRCGDKKENAENKFDERIDKAEKQKNMCDRNQKRCKEDGTTLDCGKIGNGGGSTSGCGGKSYDNVKSGSSNGREKSWVCTDNNILEKDVCVPPRIQTLCVANMANGNNITTSAFNSPETIKKHIEAAMKKETENLYKYYTSADDNKRAIISKKSNGNASDPDPSGLPKNFCLAVERTYNDFKHMVLGDIPWKADSFNKIGGKINEILKQNSGAKTTPEAWWEQNSDKFWDAIRCGIKGKPKPNGGSGNFSGDECGRYPPDDNLDSQFVWWFKEWGQQFCIERQKYIKDINENCSSSVNSRCNGVSVGKQQLTGDCKIKCAEYKTFIDGKKEAWNKQKSKYEREHPGMKAEELLGHDYPECVGANFENIFDTTTNGYGDASDICSCEEQIYKCSNNKSTCKDKKGDLSTWRTGLLKIGKDNKKLEGVYAPPRRQKLCLANLYPINFGSNANTEIKKNALQNRLQIVAEREAYYLWMQHHKNGKDDPSSHNRACCSIRSSFYDIGDIVKGTDLWDDQSKKYIDKTLNYLFKQELEEKNKSRKNNQINPDQIRQARKQWWEYTNATDMGSNIDSKTIRDGVWDAMQCGVKNAMIYLNANVNDYKDIDCLMDTSGGQRTFDSIPTPQFARWLVEWTHQFCEEYTTLMDELKTKCGNSGSSNHECNSGGKTTCKEACTKYNDWINLKRKEWVGMRKYYENVKGMDQYSSPDGVDYSAVNLPTAIGYLNQKCKTKIDGIGYCCHCKDVGNTSTGSNDKPLEHMQKVVNKTDDIYLSYKPRCTNCQLKHITDQIKKIEQKIEERKQAKEAASGSVAKPADAKPATTKPVVKPTRGQQDGKQTSQPGQSKNQGRSKSPAGQGTGTSSCKGVDSAPGGDGGLCQGGKVTTYSVPEGKGSTAVVSIATQPSPSPDPTVDQSGKSSSTTVPDTTSAGGGGSGSPGANGGQGADPVNGKGGPGASTSTTTKTVDLDELLKQIKKDVLSYLSYAGGAAVLGALETKKAIDAAKDKIHDAAKVAGGVALMGIGAGIGTGIEAGKAVANKILPAINSMLDDGTKPSSLQQPGTGNPAGSGPGSTGNRNQGSSGTGGPQSNTVLPPGGPGGGKAGKAQSQPGPSGTNPPFITKSVLSTTIPWSVGVAFVAIAYLWLKKKPKFSPVDLLRVIDIPQNDYGIPDKTSTNRYVPYGKYKGKTYIYIEGDEPDDYSYVRDISSSDITSSSESEYEDLDTNDIYPYKSPKYKTLIEVVLKPTKRHNGDTHEDAPYTQSVPLSDIPTNKLTDDKWDELKKDFILNMLQNDNMDISRENLSGNIYMDNPPHTVDNRFGEKPFITQIQDRFLDNIGQDITYNIDWNVPKNISTNTAIYNSLYSGTDLINDSLNGNEHIDIYDELLKRKENELFGTKYMKHTTTNSVSKKTNRDPISNQINLFHKWLDRHRDMCNKWNKNEMLTNLINEWKSNEKKNISHIMSDQLLDPMDTTKLYTNVSMKINVNGNNSIPDNVNQYIEDVSSINSLYNIEKNVDERYVNDINDSFFDEHNNSQNMMRSSINKNSKDASFTLSNTFDI